MVAVRSAKVRLIWQTKLQLFEGPRFAHWARALSVWIWVRANLNYTGAVRLLDRHLMMNGTPKVVRVKTNLAGAAINLSTPLVCDRAKKLITKPALGAGAICMNQYARMCETTVIHTHTPGERVSSSTGRVSFSSPASIHNVKHVAAYVQ
jgi:hypothetical protein